ncbi:MAG: type IV secretion system DNA-binding domain-containing protein [Microcoleus sp.]|uniref:type IV secretory system conjugative DNA transfer family protein n=1 Tax=Microcoleus sp. TaxID=44472 RepID=UPI003C754F3D
MNFEIKFLIAQANYTPVLAQAQRRTQQPTPLSSIDLGGLFQQYNNPDGYLTIGALIFLLLLSRFLGNGKGKITTGKVCGTSEKMAATQLALKQIKERKHNKVTLWCGSPRYWWKGKKLRGFVTTIQTAMGSTSTVWVPHAERSTLVIGAPGSGKTFSTIDRALESAMVQGFPIILYDKKGDQLKLHAPLAARYGYQVWVFAPGEAYSGIINPLDFMKSPQDSVMAGEIGQVINRNASSGNGKSDEFFSKAGDLLAKALLQLVKGSKYPDMAMLYAILRLPNLVKRIDYAVQSRQIDEWVATSFNQFLSAKEAEKTISGILTTAAGTFSSFIQADLLRAFLGKSDIPTKIEGRQMIVFKLDDERRSVVGPLLAAAIHLLVVSNLSRPRKDPLVISLDEFPSIRLDRMPQWINEYRSNGACFILGIQSLEQLYEGYGEKMGAAIASACSTHILFNPGNTDTAKKYSDRYGEKEVLLKSKSTSRSMGGQSQSNQSISWNESLQKMPLFSVDEILRFPQGRCVITNPGYSSGGEGSIPYALTIPIPKADLQRQSESEALWDTEVRLRLESRVQLASLDQLTAALYDRIEEAERMLPLPDAGGNVPSQSPTPPASGKKFGSDPLDSVVSKTGRSRRVFATGSIGKR